MRIPTLLAIAAAAPGAVAAQIKLVPFDIRVPKAPAAVVSGDRSLLVYELRVTNIGRRDLAVQRLEVSVDGKALASWDGDSLKKIAARMGDPGDGRAIAAGRQSLFYLLVSTPVGSAPASLQHRLLLTHPDSLSGPARDTLDGFTVVVSTQAPRVIESPLRGGEWLAANGPGNTSGHRRTVIPLNGQGRVAQRFAIDWVKIGPDGALWHGDSTKNENWYGYREPLHAVASGTVVALKDGIVENVPLAPNRAVPITLETVGGNHAIIDLGGGNYAFYAHMVPGSLRVKVGDKVSPGQVIGLLGNSGNSDAPHLHFHMGDAPSPLGAEGIPYLFDRYWYLGASGGFLAKWKAATAPLAQQQSLPLEDQVVRFKP